MSFTRPIVYKVVFMGDSGVGKTSIAMRIATDTFSIGTEATIGASYFSKTINKNNKYYNFNIWDTAGQEKYNCLVPLYYRNCHAAFIVYDITNELSFINAKKRVPELRNNSSVSAIMLIGNKTDLYDRIISKEEGENFAKENNLLYLETSAKSAFNTKEILDNILDRLPPPLETTASLPMVPSNSSSNYSCCNY